MSIFQSLVILLGLFISAYIFGECSLRLLFEKRNYASAAIGFAFLMFISAITCRVIMFM